MEKFKGYLRLMRPANIVTAWADILLGIGASGVYGNTIQFGKLDPFDFFIPDVLCLLLASTGLYGGGVVFNDVFDAELDKIERPERPIPSKLIPRKAAAIFGFLLLGIGICAAFLVGSLSGTVAVGIAFLAVLYDAKSKHHPFFGPLNMGACRGLNLALGLSIVPGVLWIQYPILALPIIYIFSITLVSQGEVNGGNRSSLAMGLFLYGMVVCGIISMSVFPQYMLFHTIPFLILFMGMVFPPLIKAYRSLEAQDIRKAVKAGVIALIVFDASLSAGFLGWQYGLFVLLLLPFSMFLGRIFAVT